MSSRSRRPPVSATSEMRLGVPTLREVIRACRAERAQEEYRGDGEVSEHQYDELLTGVCVENCKALSRRVEEETRFDVRVVEGAFDYEFEPTPDTYSDAVAYGSVHHWVVVQLPSGESRRCNLVSLFRENGMFVSSEKPDRFIRFS